MPNFDKSFAISGKLGLKCCSHWRIAIILTIIDVTTTVGSHIYYNYLDSRFQVPNYVDINHDSQLKKTVNNSKIDCSWCKTTLSLNTGA